MRILSQKYVLISLSVIMTAINLFLCLLLSMAVNSVRKEERARVEQRTLFENISSYYPSLGLEDIESFLLNIVGYSFRQDECILLVSPSPCDACLWKQCDIIESFMNSDSDKQIDLTVVCPRRFSREMNVRFGLSPIVYEWKEDSFNALELFGGSIIVVVRAGEIIDYYLTNRMFPDLSYTFLSRNYEGV